MWKRTARNDSLTLAFRRQCYPLLWVGFTAVAWLTPPPVRATEPSSDATLRIETGYHHGTITDFSGDAAGRFVATSSVDGTARIWDMQSLALHQVIRPPHPDAGWEVVSHIALSPDGTRVALSGEVRGNERDEWSPIQIYASKSGQWERTLVGPEYLPNFTDAERRKFPGLPRTAISWADFSALGQRVSRLQFVADSTTLIAGYSSEYPCKGGLAAWRVSDGALVRPDLSTQKTGKLVENTGAISDLTSTNQSRTLAIGCAGMGTHAEATLHVLGPRAQVMGTRSMGSDLRPSRVALRPGGGALAVLTGGTLSLLDDTTFRVTHSLKPPSRKPGFQWTAVSWTRDGTTVVASGLDETGTVLSRWGEQGTGKREDFRPEVGEVVQIVVSSEKGGVFFADRAGIIGELTEHQGAFLRITPPLPRLSPSQPIQDQIRISADGGQLLLPATGSTSRALFSIGDRRLETSSQFNRFASARKVSRPPLHPSSMSLLIFANESRPASGVAHFVVQDALNAATTTLDDAVLLGTTRRMIKATKEGYIAWERPIPQGVQQLVTAANGLVAVAALGDGTFRWYNPADGKELLALLVLPDKRWIVWSPSGYYDAGPGAEGLVGWAVRRGPALQCDFFPAARFRSLLSKPGIAAAMLATQDETSALASLKGDMPAEQFSIEERLPPVVSVVVPEFDSGVDRKNATLQVEIRTSLDAPITELKVLRAGRPVSRTEWSWIASAPSADHSKSPGTTSGTISLQLSSSDTHFAVLAQSKYGWSEPAYLELKGMTTAAPPSTVVQGFAIEPKLYVLAVGISHYQDSTLNLSFASKDAADFAATMKSQQGALYRAVEAKVLVDEQATRGNILSALDWLQHQMTQHDVGMIFMAGHGINHTDGHYYFLPVDAELKEVKRSLLPDSDVQNTLAELPGKVLLFLDTCHSGNVLGLTKRGGRLAEDQNSFLNELIAAENGVIVFTASSGSQASQESSQWQNGAFTYALVEGLKGQADFQRSGRVTLNMLDLFISERVKVLTQGAQTPTTVRPSSIRDFPIAIIRESAQR